MDNKDKVKSSKEKEVKKTTSTNKSKDSVKKTTRVSKNNIKAEEKKVENKNVESNKIDAEVNSNEKIVIKKEGFNLLEVILIMFITLVFGLMIGASVMYGRNSTTTTNKEEQSTEIPNEMVEFIETYKDLKNNYYDEIDQNGMLNAGIKGMIQFLGDKYSVYMDEEETQSFEEEVDGEYEGIGVEITVDYYDEKDPSKFNVVVNRVFPNTPASEAGLQKNDIIIKVNDESIEGKTLEDVSKLIKGGKNTKVKVTIKRGIQELDLELERRKVTVASVESKIFEENSKKIGYISIATFASNTTNQFEKELIKLEDKKIDSLIIDVRGNTGGYLSTVTEISSMFLDKSKVIYQLDTKGIVESIYATTTKSRSYPIAVLINGISASASEILAGALMESYGADIVGVNSYGKGTVQKAYQLSNGATIKYTVQKWLTPNGNWINEKGITPTYEVKQSDKYYETGEEKDDAQLQKAIEVLKNK